MKEWIKTKLNNAFNKFDTDGPSWVLKLEQEDEPPIFYHDSDVDFLSDLPESERGEIVLKFAIEKLDEIFKVLNDNDSAKLYFLSITMQNWLEFINKEKPIVTPCLLVVPNFGKGDVGDRKFLRAGKSPEAVLVASWLKNIGESSRFIVADDLHHDDPELQRVYILPTAYKRPNIVDPELLVANEIDF